MACATEELAYNSYFHLLQEKYRAKYEKARSNSWLICIPSSEALRGVDIEDNFVDLHTLELNSNCDTSRLYNTVDAQKSLVYELEGNILFLRSTNPDLTNYNVHIISEEVGYNTKFQPYKLLIVDKLLSPNITPCCDETGWLSLSGKITCYSDASSFLRFWPSHSRLMPGLEASLRDLSSRLQRARGLEEACHRVRQLVRAHWSALLTVHPQHRQRDARFQALLSAALENYVVSAVHQDLFTLTCEALGAEDVEVHQQCLKLDHLGVFPDQLGAPEDLAVQLPAAVVELAALDSLQCPIEKLVCLRACLDLILAQVKAALVDLQSVTDSEDASQGQQGVAADELLPLLMAVLIHAKPLHLCSNLFYMERLQWTLTPNDLLSCSLLTFRAALKRLMAVKVEDLPPRSRKLHRELALQDLILVTDEIVQPDRRVTSPLDRQLESIAAMIEASTLESRDPN